MARYHQDVVLLPTPRRLDMLGGVVDVPREVTVSAADVGFVERALKPAGVKVRSVAAGTGSGAAFLNMAWTVDDDPLPASVEDQRFALRIEPAPADSGGRASPVTIRATSRAGARHALMTLAQLLRQHPKKLPALAIEDRPAFAVRGVMLDVSRDRVPTMEHLLATVDALAGIKINHLQLYTEHTFAYAGHEEVWRGWSPITPAEVRELDVYCRTRGIELVANQNCFGHLEHWLNLPKYAHLAETHGDWVFDVWPRHGPFSICPVDPASLEFVRGLLDQLVPCFASKLVNIGCDETFDVGFGRSKEAVAKKGRAAVYLDFVAKICDDVRRRGLRPAFWADIALHDPSCIPTIPKDLLSLAWGYEPSSPFDDWGRILSAAGREAWMCPGTSAWRSIFGRTSERHGNLEAAAQAGVKYGSSGFLVTDWGDTGHHQQWPITLHALGHGAQVAWSADHPGAARFDGRAGSLHLFGDETLSVGPWLEQLGDADLALRETCLGLSRPGVNGRLLNQSALFADMHNVGWGEALDVGSLAAWEQAAKRVAELADAMPKGLSRVFEDELRHTLAVARFAAVRAATRRRPGGGEAGLRRKLAERLREIVAEHRRLWLARSREGGLEHSCGFYNKVLADIAPERA